MFHLTLFAGTEAQMGPRGCTTLTLFGATELHCPTLAAEIMQQRARRQERPNRLSQWLGSEDNLVITAFGATELRLPTLVEEYQALTSLVRTGVLNRQECRDLLLELEGTARARSTQRSLTVFGACTMQPPTPKREHKAIDSAAKAGSFSDEVRTALESLVAAPPEIRARGLVDLATV